MRTAAFLPWALVLALAAPANAAVIRWTVQIQSSFLSGPAPGPGPSGTGYFDFDTSTSTALSWFLPGIGPGPEQSCTPLVGCTHDVYFSMLPDNHLRFVNSNPWPSTSGWFVSLTLVPQFPLTDAGGLVSLLPNSIAEHTYHLGAPAYTDLWSVSGTLLALPEPAPGRYLVLGLVVIAFGKRVHLV